MVDETERSRKIQRGNGAAALLDSPVLQEAFDALRERNFELHCSTDLGETDRREDLWKMRKAIDAIEEQLRAFVDIGKIENVNRLEDSGKKE